MTRFSSFTLARRADTDWPSSGMHDVRRQLGEGQEHEPPFVHLRMGHLECAFVDDLLIAEEDVEVDDA